MALELRANTAVDILIGPFVDDTDGKTPETGLTIDVELSKNGQALTNKSDATAPTHDANRDIDGYYNCELDTTDTNTEGTLVVACFATGALPRKHEYMVLSEAAWDSKYVAKDDGFMDVNIKTVGRVDTQETEADNLESACANYSATRGLTGTALPAAACDAAGGIPKSTAGGLDLDAKLANTNEVTVARMGALTDLIDGGRLDLLIDAIKAITDQFGFTGVAPNTWANVQVKGQDNIDFGALQKASLNAATPASVGDVTGTITDKTGYGIGVGGIAAAAFAANAINAAALNADAAAEIADKILGRAIAGSADGGRTVSQALQILRNKRAIADGTLTVYAADDATPSWTAEVATTAGNPVSSVDPA